MNRLFEFEKIPYHFACTHIHISSFPNPAEPAVYDRIEPYLISIQPLCVFCRNNIAYVKLINYVQKPNDKTTTNPGLLSPNIQNRQQIFNSGFG